MIVLLMGVSGSGKTAVGESLAARTHWVFVSVDTDLDSVTSSVIAALGLGSGEASEKE